MASPGSGSQTETYAYTKETTEVTVVPRIVTQSEQIARYFTEDLHAFVDEMYVDLVRWLEIPPDFPQDNKEIVELLYADLSHMLRDGLITGIHILLSDMEIDPNRHGYPVRYHARYCIQLPERHLRTSEAKRIGGKLAPPRDVWINARFALLIDWNPKASVRSGLGPPDYVFEWVLETARFDVSSLVRYRQGGMTIDSARVDRREAAAPGSFGN